MAQTDSNTDAADRESVHPRVLNASREQVVDAFREPDRFARWWGPKGFRSTIHSFDFWPGGRLSWRQRFDTREHFERVKSVVAEANEQNLDRLAAELSRSRKP